jgi:hypothetical protein
MIICYVQEQSQYFSSSWRYLRRGVLLARLATKCCTLKVVLERFELFAGTVRVARIWPQGYAPTERK